MDPAAKRRREGFLRKLAEDLAAGRLKAEDLEAHLVSVSATGDEERALHRLVKRMRHLPDCRDRAGPEAFAKARAEVESFRTVRERRAALLAQVPQPLLQHPLAMIRWLAENEAGREAFRDPKVFCSLPQDFRDEREATKRLQACEAARRLFLVTASPALADAYNAALAQLAREEALASSLYEQLLDLSPLRTNLERNLKRDQRQEGVGHAGEDAEQRAAAIARAKATQERLDALPSREDLAERVAEAKKTESARVAQAQEAVDRALAAVLAWRP